MEGMYGNEVSKPRLGEAGLWGRTQLGLLRIFLASESRPGVGVDPRSDFLAFDPIVLCMFPYGILFLVPTVNSGN